jgi:hypothetical protein
VIRENLNTEYFYIIPLSLDNNNIVTPLKNSSARRQRCNSPCPHLHLLPHPPMCLRLLFMISATDRTRVVALSRMQEHKNVNEMHLNRHYFVLFPSSPSSSSSSSQTAVAFQTGFNYTLLCLMSECHMVSLSLSISLYAMPCQRRQFRL